MLLLPLHHTHVKHPTPQTPNPFSFIDCNDLYIVFEWAELGDLRRMLKKREHFYEEAHVYPLITTNFPFRLSH